MTFTRVAKLSALALALGPSFAYGYLDPGTGSALIQGVIAAIAAIGLTLKVYWHRVLGFLGLRRKADADEDEPDTGQPPAGD